MSAKVAVELGPVQETLLIPLLGRAEETKKTRGILRDEKALHIVESLDYDFEKWRGIPSLQGATLRTRMFDEEVGRFLRAHPFGTVIELGAGLNTRYERLDNGRAHWLELDLPDSMALRRRFFEETERRTMVAGSVLDADWYPRALALPRPYCFVAEAVLIYLDNDDVERMLRALAAAFSGALLITDTTASPMVDAQHKHDAMKKLSRSPGSAGVATNPGRCVHGGRRWKRPRRFSMLRRLSLTRCRFIIESSAATCRFLSAARLPAIGSIVSA